MNKFIFSVEEIFDKSDRGYDNCLWQNKVKRYYIGPYQRGFKWKSKYQDDQIPVLLTDLYEAFIKSKDSKEIKDYFLQYITVKITEDKDEPVFEVIDGQQRLTSLTLMFNVLKKYFAKENLAKDRNNKYLVTYSRYDSNGGSIFFDDILQLLEKEDLIDNEITEQDRYYLLQASKCFKKFFEILIGEKDEDGKYEEAREKEFDLFFNYIRKNVQIILNREDEFSSAEEVFANLNANKILLTNAYLVKGLLLTKASRSIENGTRKKHFKEIMDERAIMGRLWDEMNSWFNENEVSSFFFYREDNTMELMLSLVHEIYYGDSINSNEVIKRFNESLTSSENNALINFELFNRFHESIRTPEDSRFCLNYVKHVYKRLRSWYEDPEMYNLIGFKQFAPDNKYKSVKEQQKQFKNNILELLKIDSNEEVIDMLEEYLKRILPLSKEQIEKLNYSSGQKLTNVLLALSVFPEFEDSTIKKKYKFDFYSFSKEDWSLEHIFPQSPYYEKFNDEDKKWIIEKIKERIDLIKSEDPGSGEINILENTVKAIQANEEINNKVIDFLFTAIKDIDSIGNMALLSGKVNSALSNSFFNTKRKILMKKINDGNFVPKHTIDVFSKMLPTVETEDPKDFEQSLTMWTDKDVEAHRVWIIYRINQIITQQKEENEDRTI